MTLYKYTRARWHEYFVAVFSTDDIPWASNIDPNQSIDFEKKSIQINLKYWKNWFWNQFEFSRFLKAKINMQINLQINV